MEPFRELQLNQPAAFPVQTSRRESPLFACDIKPRQSPPPRKPSGFSRSQTSLFNN